MLVSIICRAPEACGQLANIIAITLSEGRGGRDPFTHVNSWKVGTESTLIEQWTTERYNHVFISTPGIALCYAKPNSLVVLL